MLLAPRPAALQPFPARAVVVLLATVALAVALLAPAAPPVGAVQGEAGQASSDVAASDRANEEPAATETLADEAEEANDAAGASAEVPGLWVRGGVSAEEMVSALSDEDPEEAREMRQRIRNVLVPWSTDKRRAERLLGRDALILCVPAAEGIETCATRPGEWSVDFGQQGWMPGPTLSFHRDRFFLYSVPFDSRLYETVRGWMSEYFGGPGARDGFEIQDRLGGRHEQERAIWRTDDVMVELLQRSPADVWKGSLTVAYLPVARTVPGLVGLDEP